MAEGSTGEHPAAAIPSPSISKGAQKLLVIAQRDDTQGAMAGNAALRISLERLAGLPGLCAGSDQSVLYHLLGQKELPASFFGFCAALANVIDLRVADSAGDLPQGRSLATDFDHSVLLALGQALTDAVREPGEQSPELGPRIEVALPRLALTSAHNLQRLLVQHYVGNILQDYFDRCRLRLRIPELPPDTELKLRTEDAHAIADTLFAHLPRAGAGVEPERVQESLRNLLAELSRKDEGR